MIAFNPSGPIQSFTAAASAPTSVFATGTTQVGTQQYCITNTDTANDVVLGWGASDAEAKENAASINAKSYYLMHSTQVVVTASDDAYFTGIAVASTAVVKVQPGIGN